MGSRRPPGIGTTTRRILAQRGFASQRHPSGRGDPPVTRADKSPAPHRPPALRFMAGSLGESPNQKAIETKGTGEPRKARPITFTPLRRSRSPPPPIAGCAETNKSNDQWRTRPSIFPPMADPLMRSAKPTPSKATRLRVSGVMPTRASTPSVAVPSPIRTWTPAEAATAS